MATQWLQAIFSTVREAVRLEHQSCLPRDTPVAGTSAAEGSESSDDEEIVSSRLRPARSKRMKTKRSSAENNFHVRVMAE
jgi:hypothetical protein